MMIMERRNGGHERDRVIPDAFISYSHADKDFAHNLAKRLNQEKVNGGRLRVEMDDTAFIPGESLIDSIERGVRDARKLVCILSPDFLASDWTALETQIKMLDDPAGRKGLIIPVLYRECDVPYSLRNRLWADFRREENHERAYQRLLGALLDSSTLLPARELEPTAGESRFRFWRLDSHEPDRRDETLSLNVFEVVQAPENVWHAATSCRTPLEVLSAVDDRVRSIFTLRAGELWTFDSLGDWSSPLLRVIDENTIAKSPLETMVGDTKLRSVAMELLNKALAFHLKNAGLLQDRRYGRFYFPPNGQGIRKVAWPGLKRKALRTVTVPRHIMGRIDRYEHLAVIMRFVALEQGLGLLVLPTRAVTEEGYRPKRGPKVGPRVTSMTRQVYNNRFWLDVMFWLHQLHEGGRAMIYAGDQSIEVQTSPLQLNLVKGIRGDTLSMFDEGYADRWYTEASSLEGELEEEDEEPEEDRKGGVE